MSICYFASTILAFSTVFAPRTMKQIAMLLFNAYFMAFV